jgi:dolichol kinase
MMIGNLPFIIPFFSYNSFPVNFPFFVAAPFIIVSLLASSHSPSKRIYEKMKGLSVLTGGGHQLGLVFYSISYTVLAFFFSAKPYFIAAGILPMAYGEKYGKRRYHVFAPKSIEGSIAMFLASFLSLAVSLAFFSMLYPLPLFNSILAALAVALVAVFAETLSPLGLDNLTVPLLSSLTFFVLMGGI